MMEQAPRWRLRTWTTAIARLEERKISYDKVDCACLPDGRSLKIPTETN